MGYGTKVIDFEPPVSSENRHGKFWTPYIRPQCFT